MASFIINAIVFFRLWAKWQFWCIFCFKNSRFLQPSSQVHYFHSQGQDCLEFLLQIRFPCGFLSRRLSFPGVFHKLQYPPESSIQKHLFHTIWIQLLFQIRKLLCPMCSTICATSFKHHLNDFQWTTNAPHCRARQWDTTTSTTPTTTKQSNKCNNAKQNRNKTMYAPIAISDIRTG